MNKLKCILVIFALFVFTAVTNTDQVKIFSEPTPAGTVVSVLRLGDVVKVYQKSPDGQYLEVEHKGKHGWVIFKYLSPKDNRYSTEI
ncbi:SH3 domain-containing protein [Sporomusa termitida]|uniref:SH3b domain-containing protein n=1 Tax=Sporomusa termitida TaxID=2377 RepID=A0A517DZQ1_9FIRM|nr:SH3 domain-containing protein [Sporomusa termitida]QDR82840.1 hypothetical protein SPTER_42790 [Sporomusa termitida]